MSDPPPSDPHDPSDLRTAAPAPPRSDDDADLEDDHDPVGEVRAAIDRPDPLYFQQASMLTLTFRFRGKRKLVASRLMERADFVAELEAYLPVLAACYPDHEVSAVEIVSYQKGAFYYDPWPGGLELVEAWMAEHRSEEEALDLAAAALEPDDAADDGGEENARNAD